MRTTIRWGMLVGLVMAGVTWSMSNSISLFPGVISLLLFVLLTSFALRKSSPPFADWGDVFRTASLFGATSGAIIALSVGLRAMMTWQRPVPLAGPYDLRVEAVVVASSWLVILLLTNFVALLACRPARVQQRPAV